MAKQSIYYLLLAIFLVVPSLLDPFHMQAERVPDHPLPIGEQTENSATLPPDVEEDTAELEIIEEKEPEAVEKEVDEKEENLIEENEKEEGLHKKDREPTEKEESETTPQEEEATEPAPEVQTDAEKELPQKEEKAEISSPSLQGVLDIALLDRVSLRASQSSNGSKERITLVFEGRGVINLGLLQSTYIIFHLPPELVHVINQEDLSASYDVPGLGLLGITIRNKGNFKNKDIMIQGNQVMMNFTSLLSLNLLSRERYTFTLNIDIDEMPVSEVTEYHFMSQATKQIIDLSLLGEEPVAHATLSVPHRPNMPIVDSLYENDTVITGRATPQLTVIAKVSGKEYSSTINNDGKFQIAVPPLAKGAPVYVYVKCPHGYESDDALVTVQPLPDAPKLDSVYSEDEIVTGSGPKEKKIRLEIEGNTYESHIDAEGYFTVSIPAQEAGTVITARTVNEDGRLSEAVMTEVLKARLEMIVPRQLAFETTAIVAKEQMIKRQQTDWQIVVKDTRRTGSNWRITAEANKPLTLDENPEFRLDDALVFVDEHGNKQVMGEAAVAVYEGETTAERLNYVNWEPDRGPLLYLNPADALVGEYATDITWTLIDAP